MNIVVITQARTGSSRLANKVLLKIQNKELVTLQKIETLYGDNRLDTTQYNIY